VTAPPKPKEPICVVESDNSKYGGQKHGTLTWISTGDAPPKTVVIQGKAPDAGRVIADGSLPHLIVHITITPGANIVQAPTNCNDWRLYFEPNGLSRVQIDWRVE
jgi:hypothetical protein